MNAKRNLNVLALNSGSSSLKFGLYRVESLQTRRLIAGEAESIGEKAGILHAEDAKGGTLLRETAAFPSQKEAIIRIARLLAEMKTPVPQAIGHRIVHGGPKLKQHCVIDDSVLNELKAAAAFAPLHMPAALSVIRFSQAHFRKRVGEAPCRGSIFYLRRLISGRTSSITMFSAAALPSATFSRCSRSATLSVSPQTKATRTFLPTAASAARRIGGISPMVI